MTITDHSDVHDSDFIHGTRVLLDGEDISNRCYRAEIYEDGTGKAYCYRQRDGKPYHDEKVDDVAREELVGRIEIIRP